jgi:hypothetical protein
MAGGRLFVERDDLGRADVKVIVEGGAVMLYFWAQEWQTMTVQNRIIKVQKRNRALVSFDEERICKAVLRAADSIGGFQQDHLPGINDKIFETYDTDEKIAEFVADIVVLCLNCAATDSRTRRTPTNAIGGVAIGFAKARSTKRNSSATVSRGSGWKRRWSGTASGVATRSPG